MGKKQQNISEQIHDFERKPATARAIHYFEIPERLAEKVGVKEVGLIELSTGEELMATKRCGGDAVVLAFQLARESLRFIDGRPVNTGDNSTDEFWESNKSGMFAVRTMMVGAFSSIHAPKNDEVADFLASRRTEVG